MGLRTQLQGNDDHLSKFPPINKADISQDFSMEAFYGAKPGFPVVATPAVSYNNAFDSFWVSLVVTAASHKFFWRRWDFCAFGCP